MTTFTRDDAAWDECPANENPSARLIRNLLATIALGLEEAGCPLTPEQDAFLKATVEPAA